MNPVNNELRCGVHDVVLLTLVNQQFPKADQRCRGRHQVSSCLEKQCACASVGHQTVLVNAAVFQHLLALLNVGHFPDGSNDHYPYLLLLVLIKFVFALQLCSVETRSQSEVTTTIIVVGIIVVVVGIAVVIVVIVVKVIVSKVAYILYAF